MEYKDMRNDTASMERRVENASDVAGRGISESVKDMTEMEEELINLVRDTLLNSLRATGSVTSEAANVTRDVTKATVQAGEEIGVVVIHTTSNLAKALIGGALDTAGSVGKSAMSAAGAIMSGMVAGIRDVAVAAMPRARTILSNSMEPTATYDEETGSDASNPENRDEIHLRHGEDTMQERESSENAGLRFQPDPEAPYDEEFNPTEQEEPQRPKPWIVRGY